MIGLAIACLFGWNAVGLCSLLRFSQIWVIVSRRIIVLSLSIWPVSWLWGLVESICNWLICLLSWLITCIVMTSRSLELCVYYWVELRLYLSKRLIMYRGIFIIFHKRNFITFPSVESIRISCDILITYWSSISLLLQYLIFSLRFCKQVSQLIVFLSNSLYLLPEYCLFLKEVNLPILLSHFKLFS